MSPLAALLGGLALCGVAALVARCARIVGRLRRAGTQAAAAWRVVLAGAALALVLALASWLVLRLPVLTIVAALGGAATPALSHRSRVRRAAREAERAWGAALDQLADALEAGLAFPAAAAFVAASGPAPVAGRFARLVERLRHGELEPALDELAAAPEHAARASAALLRAALVELPTGGLAPLLRELARTARERFDVAERARTRSLALQREATVLVASPLAFLLLIGWSAPGYLDAYRSGAGTLVSLAAALVIGACYLAMLRLGRIAEPGRGQR